MRIIFFSAKPYDREFFEAANTAHRHELSFLGTRSSSETALLAKGAAGVCAFVNDRLDADVLKRLAEGGTRFILLRSAGYDHVDRSAAKALGLRIGYVPRYSSYAVAEHTVALILSLNRKIHRAYARVREGNFSIDGLLGFDLHGRTVGRIGLQVGKIMNGFGCKVLAYDPATPDLHENGAITLGSFNEVIERSDILSLHCPLTATTHHLINDTVLRFCRRGAMLINTSRGALINTPDVITALKSGQLGSLGIDVYEDEAQVFYEDYSSRIIDDDVLSRLISFPNVLITAHQGFFTREALTTIAQITLSSATNFEKDLTAPEELLFDGERK